MTPSRPTGPSDYQPGQPGQPGRQQTTARFGSVGVTVTLSAQPQRYRTPPANGNAHLHSVRAGRLLIDQAGTLFELGPGDALLVVGAHPPSRLTGEMVSISVPQALLRDVPVPGSVWPIPRQTTLLEPTVAFARRAAAGRSDDGSPLALYYAERLLQEMILGVVVDASQSARVPAARDAYSAALSVITARCGDPELTAHMIAREINLSLRQLERTFNARSTTLSREIRRARVARASQLLLDPSYDALSIEQVARYSGFSRGSSLARAMREEGLDVPGKVRSRRLGPGRSGTTATTTATHSDRGDDPEHGVRNRSVDYVVTVPS